MADYKIAVDKTLINEGLFDNDPRDPGGMTYRGISRKSWSSWAGWHIIDHILNNYKSKSAQINQMTKNKSLQEEVYTFYKKRFWDKIKGDDIVSQEIANSVFDYSVNAHYKTASRAVQRIVGCKPDGAIGPISIRHINNYSINTPSYKFQINFLKEKSKRYRKIVKRNDKLSVYLFGWISRSFKYVEEVIDINLLSNYINDKLTYRLYNVIVLGRDDKSYRNNEKTVNNLKGILNKL